MTEKTDPYLQWRRQMVEKQLQGRGITDPRVLRAFLKVPRHEFVPEHLREQAYRDGPLPIGEEQTISQPYIVATMTELARIHPGDRVLEIGTGSGYQAAILAELGARVYSVERKPKLAAEALDRLRKLGYSNVEIKVGDGTLGWPEKAPFQAILVTAGAPQAPQPLLDQLDVGGRLVIPLQETHSQVLYVITRQDGSFVRQRGEACSFVPLIGQYGWGEDPRLN